MESNKVIGIVVALVLVAALLLTIVFARQKTVAGAVSSTEPMSSEGFSSYEEMMAAHHPEQSKAAQNQGFNSYEEMMAAHHGGSQGGGDSAGCGGVAEGSVKAEFAGQTSDYGVTYDDAGYQKLLGYAKSINLDAAQTKLIVGLDVQIPCCGFKTLQASGNCECGHHVALYGLAKLLASKGYTSDQIQSEIDKWKQVFYPAGSDSGAGGC